jgi:hypothetical protein
MSLALPIRLSWLRRHPSEFVQRHRFEDSTGNLAKHVEKCTPAETSASQSITAFANGTTYSAPRFRYLLSIWCARRHRPFSIVMDPELVELFKMLYARVEIPHPKTISRDVKEIHLLCKERVAKMLGVGFVSRLQFFELNYAVRSIQGEFTLVSMGGHPQMFSPSLGSLYIVQ